MSRLEDQQFTNQSALWPFIKRISAYAWRHKTWIKAFSFWIFLVAVVDAIYPIVVKGLIDNVLVPQMENYKAAIDSGSSYAMDFSGIWIYAGWYILLSAISVLGVFYFIKYTGRVQEYVIYDLRQAMFEKLQKLSFSFYDRSSTGWLLTRLTSDTDRVAELISWGLIEFVFGTTMMFFCLAFLFYFSWKLALVVTLSIPIMIFASIKIRMLVLQYSRKARKVNSELTASYTEHINGVAVNKSTAQEARVSEEFSLLTNTMRRVSYRAAFYTALYFPVVIFLGSLAAAIVVYWGGSMKLAGEVGLTTGMLWMAFEYAMKIFLPILDISMVYARAQGSLSAGERIFSLLDEEFKIKDSKDATDFDPIRGDITFQNVNFNYDNGQQVLRNFTLEIKAGQSIALVGATGEGKSTIINLICRFYEPTTGQLLIDGKDYTKQTLDSLRKQLGIVLQTPHLFKGSIRDNVQYGQLNASEDEIKNALKLVGAEAFIGRLDEEVGEGGERLSQGEQQLISFARAVLARPRIFIMDEATASIDTMTEVRIQKSIEKMLDGRTSIIIAHRLSTIKNCDRILVIQKGQILEDGSHEDLLEKKGRYYSLYTRQLRSNKMKTV